MPAFQRLRIIAHVVAATLLISGCQAHPQPISARAPAPGPAAPTSTTPVTIKQPPATTQFWTPPDIPLTEDLPTYPTETVAPLIETVPPPAGPTALAAIAGALVATGDPAAAAGSGAQYIGSMAVGRHVYAMSAEPGPTAYILQREAEGWTATPICQAEHSVWFWPGTLATQEAPVVICATTAGSTALLTASVYQTDRQILTATGLRHGTLTVRDRPGAPPDLILTGGRVWLATLRELMVTERFTLTWRDGAYHLTNHERMADETYHLARLTALVARGDYARAEADFAPGGLEAYLQTHAPHFRDAAGGVLSTRGYTHYLAKGVDGPGPWFHFDFAPDGRVAELFETDPPKP